MWGYQMVLLSVKNEVVAVDINEEKVYLVNKNCPYSRR